MYAYNIYIVYSDAYTRSCRWGKDRGGVADKRVEIIVVIIQRRSRRKDGDIFGYD